MVIHVEVFASVLDFLHAQTFHRLHKLLEDDLYAFFQGFGVIHFLVVGDGAPEIVQHRQDGDMLFASVEDEFRFFLVPGGVVTHHGAQIFVFQLVYFGVRPAANGFFSSAGWSTFVRLVCLCVLTLVCSVASFLLLGLL